MSANPKPYTASHSRPTSHREALDDATEAQIVALPHHAKAEQVLLSVLLGHGRSVAEQVVPLTVPDDFYFGNHRVIFDAIVTAYAEGSEVSPLTVAEVLDRRGGGLRDIGGMERLEVLASNAPAERGAIPAAKMLRTYRQKRDLIRATQKIAAMAGDLQENHEVLLSRAVALIQEAAQSEKSATRTEKIVRVGQRVIADMHERSKTGSEILGVTSGLRSWDLHVGGIIPKKFNLLAGASGMGKTAGMMTLLKGSASAGAPGIVFSLEMENDALYHRALAMHCSIDTRRLSVGDLNSEEWERVNAAQQYWDRLPVELNDCAGMTVRDIEAATRDFVSRVKGKYPPVVFVDYAQLIAPMREERDATEAKQIERNAYALYEMAKNMGLGLVVTAQLNRKVDEREDHRPRLSDIADSSGLVKVSDTITFCYRPAYYTAQKSIELATGQSDEEAIFAAKYRDADPDEAEWIVAKGRSSGVRALRMTYHPTKTMFTAGGLEMRGF